MDAPAREAHHVPTPAKRSKKSLTAGKGGFMLGQESSDGLAVCVGCFRVTNRT